MSSNSNSTGRQGSSSGSPSSHRDWFHPKTPQKKQQKDSKGSFDRQIQNRAHWEELLVWDLNSIQKLRELILIWVQAEVSASNIGEFLQQVLYRRDEHLNYRLTKMVDNGATHAEIAHTIMQHYQIRDHNDKPLWVDVKLQSPSSGDTGKPKARHSGHEEPWSPTSAPVRPTQWPLFLQDLNIDSSVENFCEESDERDDESSRPRRSINFGEEDIPILDDERRIVLINNTGTQPKRMTQIYKCDNLTLIGNIQTQVPTTLIDSQRVPTPSVLVGIIVARPVLQWRVST
ncbi:hypothetical protein N7495_006896 [Penicillium taxi]|uniref:uncharacterized protein n=1 Tax=Penicillium taxi TaxID=168475 RepID=UPI00254578C3|nr:uncharacterized protein N7495_006896 [Penicillium taxi]KAJ5895205.1 hypothetical protein N7495_006896 [Penicillium taxi]